MTDERTCGNCGQAVDRLAQIVFCSLLGQSVNETDIACRDYAGKQTEGGDE